MAKRSRLTVEFLVKMPLPAGAKPKEAQDFLAKALLDAPPVGGMRGYSPEQTIIKLVRRETVYL